MTERTMHTDLLWHDSTGQKCSAAAIVVYVVHKGYRQTMEQPGEPDSVEIVSVKPDWVPARFTDEGTDENEGLIEKCYADYREDLIAAAEYKAEQRADDLMREKW